MKTQLIYKLIVAMGLIVIASCTSDETKVTYLGGTAPVLTVSDTASLVLTKAQENYNSLQFSWTYPNYKFSNGASTQDVFYTLQFDSVGANFANPGTLAFTNSLSNAFFVKDLNNALGTLQYKDYVQHKFEFRVKATMASGSAVYYSNVITMKITTYLDVVYPVPDNLYITGSATPGSWQAGSGSSEVVPPNQQFTKVNSYTFQIDALQLTFNGTADGDNGFLLLPVYGSWSAKYGFTGSKHGNNGLGDSFEPNGNDFSPPPTGNYKIVVNFKTGKYTMTKN
ncbi:MAG: SusE domain-containing protein [Cyclobacteriaceae bacterium]